MSRFILPALFAVLLFVPLIASAQIGTVGTFGGLPGGNNLIGAITTIINAFLALVSIVGVIFLIIGGVQFLTSRGDTQQAQQAKNTIIFAVIGLIVVLLSAVIVNFVITIFV